MVLTTGFPATCCAPKNYRYGTDRFVAPDKTLDKVRPLMSAMGITRLANVTGLDIIGVPVVMACRPNSRSLSVTQGKGLTLKAAMVSALMEAVEGYHADHITLPLKLGSFNDLRSTHRLVDALHLPTGNSGPFLIDRPLLWVEGSELYENECIWVPYDVVHTDFTYASRLGQGMFDTTSNGLASGNHLLEAISHGICEVIERDATALWFVSSDEYRHTTRLDLDTVDDINCRNILDQLASANILSAVWETTSDIGLPAFMCNIVENIGNSFHTLYASEGMGCHPRREIALLRALTEAIQSRLTYIVGSRDDVFRFEYERLRDPRAVEFVRTHISLAEKGTGRRFQDVPTFERETFDEDVELELAHLQSAGVDQVIVVDLTKPEFGLPVVRVVIPGLECFISSERYKPGVRAQAYVEVHQ